MTGPEPEAILWLRVQKGEFFNVERHPEMKSSRVRGHGPQYLEIPTSLVQRTFDFLGHRGSFAAFSVPHTIMASAVANGQFGPIEFNKKSATSGNRLYIPRQNRQAAHNIRHPGWSPSAGFPKAPDDVRNRDEAAAYIPAGGIRLYIIRMDDGTFRAGFTTGFAPAGLAQDDPNQLLYQGGRGGLILFEDGEAVQAE